MKIKKIVVTGGLGFIGSNLIELLIKKNYKVINIDKVSYSSNFYNIKNFKNDNNYKFYKIDINNKLEITNILLKEKPIAIFNLAADTHVDRSIDSPYPFIKNNILGIFNLLEASMDYYKKNPSASASLRGTLYEEKIIDFIKSKAKSNKKVLNKIEAEKIIKAENEKNLEEQNKTIKASTSIKDKNKTKKKENKATLLKKTKKVSKK